MSDIAKKKMETLMQRLDSIKNDPNGAIKAVKGINQISTAIDLLGLLKSQIADLENVETALKEKLVAEKFSEREGDFYRATVSSSTRETLDMDAVRAKLTAQFIAKHTKTTVSTSVRIVAKNGQTQAAA